METVAFCTLGCKVNQYEEEAMVGLFRKAGYQIVDFDSRADVYVIHTCTVTAGGARKSRKMIRRARDTNPDAVVAVTGCYPQTAPDEVRETTEIELMLGTQERAQIVELVERAKAAEEPLNYVRQYTGETGFESLDLAADQDRTRAVIKVQEGCDHHCAYCIIPRARGPVRSRPRGQVIDEACRLEAAGFREVVLTGINLAAYGRDFAEKYRLADLLQELVDMTRIPRFRLSSVEPDEIDSRLVELVGNKRICSHLHIPLQHGDDAILERMNRGYTVAEYSEIVDKLRGREPDLGLTTDLMVGFPGETAGHFQNTLNTAERLAFSRIHVFRYSRREGTPAAGFSKEVPSKTAKERSAKLRDLAGHLARRFHRRFVGRTLSVLVEKRNEDENLEGVSDNYIRVEFSGPDGLENRIVDVRIQAACEKKALGLYKPG